MRNRCGDSRSWAAGVAYLLISLSAPFGWAQRGAPESGEWLPPTITNLKATVAPFRSGPLYTPQSHKATGDEIASVDLLGGAIGTPMPYMLDGRQYVAVTVGGARAPSLSGLALSE